MSDTPRTDEQINGKPCTRFAILAGDSLRDASVPSEFARTIERELNAANDRIKRLEEDLMDAKNQYAVLAADVVLYEDRGERIKRLEGIISRAACAFFRDGSDGKAANAMLTILEEVRKL